MREIKFRAWDERHKCYEEIHDFYWFEENGVHVGNGDGSSGSYFLEQFTGLRDSRGVEIYEGDIIETTLFHEGHTLPHRGVIVFSEEFGSFATKNEGGITLAYNHAVNTRKIIGNIHENLRLME